MLLTAALSAAPALITAGKSAWHGYKGVKGAINTVNNFRRAPAEMAFTFQLCSCLVDALAVAEALATRHSALKIVGSAVLLARAAVQQCHSLVDVDTIEDTEDSWAQWSAGRKFQELQSVQSRLALAISSLQCALTAVAASHLPHGIQTSPFSYLPEAWEQAHAALLEIEMGRTRSILLCSGHLWQRGTRKNTDEMEEVFQCRLRLHRGQRKIGAEEDDDSGDEDDDEDEEEEEEKPARGKRTSQASAPAAKPPTRSSRASSSASVAAAKAAAGAPPPVDVSTPEKENTSLCLWYIASGDDDDDEEEKEECEKERVISLDESVKLRRVWSQEYASELPRKHGSTFLEVVGSGVLCYEFVPSLARRSPTATGGVHSQRPLLLTFQIEGSKLPSGTVLSAEAFEALVFMAIGTRKADAAAKGGSRSVRSVPLANTYDPDEPAAYVARMAACVGQLTGMPEASKKAGGGGTGRSRRGAADDDEAIAGLITPVRGLGIS